MIGRIGRLSGEEVAGDEYGVARVPTKCIMLL